MDGEADFSMDYFDDSMDETMNPLPSRGDPLSSTLDLGSFSREPNDAGNGSSSEDSFIDSLFRGHNDVISKIGNHTEGSVEPVGTTSNTSHRGPDQSTTEISTDEAEETVAIPVIEEFLPEPEVESIIEDELSRRSSLLVGQIPIEMPLVAVAESIISAHSGDAFSAGVKIESGSGKEKSQLGDTTQPSFYELSPTAEGLQEVFDIAMEDTSNVLEGELSGESNQSTNDVNRDSISASVKKKSMPADCLRKNVEHITQATGLGSQIAEVSESQERAGSEEIEERPAGSPSVPILDLPEEITAEDKVTTCIVANCQNYRNTKADHVFPFPDPVMQFALRKQWLKKINEHCGKTIMLSGVALLKTKQAGVCNQHFVKEDFASGWSAYPGKSVKYKLKQQAVPSVFLNPTDSIRKLQPLKQSAAAKQVRQYATKTVEPAKKRLALTAASSKPSGPSIDVVDPGIIINSGATSTGMGKRNRSKMGSGDLSEDIGKSKTKKIKADGLQETDSFPSNEDSMPNKKKVGTLANTSGKLALSHDQILAQAAAAAALPPTTVVNPWPVNSNFQVPHLVMQQPEQMQNQVFMVQTTSLDGKVTSLPYVLTNTAGGPQLTQFVPRPQTVTRMITPKIAVRTQARATAPIQMRAIAPIRMKTTVPIQTKNTVPNFRAPSKINGGLALTPVVPAPPVAPAHTEIQLAPVVASASSASAWNNSRAPCRAVGVQVGSGDLEEGWEDEEIKDLMREAHEEIFELKYALETTELELSVEKTKVTHLEARVVAWIREHFTLMSVETERQEVLDQLANYYLEVARRLDESRKSTATEVELYRTNYSRSQKETESYRQQIIELQNNSARQVETLHQQKQKQERESQEVIAALRRQLSEAITAKSAAEYELRVLLGGKASAGPPPSTGGKARGPRKPRESSTPKATTGSVASVVTSFLSSPAPVTTVTTGAVVTPIQPPKSPVQYVNPHLVNASSTSGNATPAPVAARLAAQPAPPSASPAPRKRGRPAKDNQERTSEIDGLPIPSPKKSGTRESSVERAVRYLMSL